MNKLESLEIIDTVVGSGVDEVKSGDIVIMEYVGKFYGTENQFDAGKNFQTQIGIGQVIKGWDVGVVGMKIGGLRKLNIPSEMAYGKTGAGNTIPPDSDLTFEVKLSHAFRPLK